MFEDVLMGILKNLLLIILSQKLTEFASLTQTTKLTGVFYFNKNHFVLETVSNPG